MAFQRIRVTDIGMLFRLVVARALHILGVADLDLVGERIEHLVQYLVHAVDIVRLEIVSRIHQQTEAGMIDLRKHLDGLLDGADDVVHVGFEQEDRAVVIGMLGKIGDDLAALLEALFRLVLRVMHPVGFRVVGAGFRDDIGRAEMTRVTDDFLEIADAAVALGLIGVDDVRVAGDAGDRQVMIAEGLADPDALVLGDLAGRKVNILEVHVELHSVEVERADFLCRLFQRIGEIAGENTCLHHDENPPSLFMN